MTYEVRGWRYTSGFTNSSIHSESIAVGFIGDFTEKELSYEQFEELKAFIVEARRKGQLISDYKIYGVKSHDVDGWKMFEKLRKMSHWEGFL